MDGSKGFWLDSTVCQRSEANRNRPTICAPLHGKRDESIITESDSELKQFKHHVVFCQPSATLAVRRRSRFVTVAVPLLIACNNGIYILYSCNRLYCECIRLTWPKVPACKRTARVMENCSQLRRQCLGSRCISALISVFRQVLNGIALLAISLHPRFGVHKFAGPAVLVGSSIFSGTIMALVLNRDRYLKYAMCHSVSDNRQVSIPWAYHSYRRVNNDSRVCLSSIIEVSVIDTFATAMLRWLCRIRRLAIKVYP